jgi:hypothetical protein
VATDLSRWYGAQELLGIAILATVAVYGFHTSLGGRPAFGSVTLEEV